MVPNREMSPTFLARGIGNYRPQEPPFLIQWGDRGKVGRPVKGNFLGRRNGELLS